MSYPAWAEGFGKYDNWYYCRFQVPEHFLVPLTRYKYLSLFSFIFTLWSAWMAKCTICQVLFLLIITRFGLLAGISYTWYSGWDWLFFYVCAPIFIVCFDSCFLRYNFELKLKEILFYFSGLIFFPISSTVHLVCNFLSLLLEISIQLFFLPILFWRFFLLVFFYLSWSCFY